MNLREEFPRTECGCARCCVGCRTMPGTLAPGDVERIARSQGMGVEELADSGRLLASEGARYLRINHRTGAVQTMQHQSIVPAQDETGACVFLGDDGECTIHAVSPFGCAGFDSHHSHAESESRAHALIGAIEQAHKGGLGLAGAIYRTVCRKLVDAGRQAAPLKDRRGAYNRAELKIIQGESNDGSPGTMPALQLPA